MIKFSNEKPKPNQDRTLVPVAVAGAGLIEHLLRGLGATVIYTSQPEDESVKPKLVRNMLAIVTSFVGKLYGQQSAKARRLRAVVAAETRSSVA